MDHWRFLRKLPLFEEIELRLRHHWTGTDVAEWIQRENPQHVLVDATLIDAYVQAQPADWRIPVLVARAPGRRAARILALEEHTEVVRVQVGRCKTFLELEESLALPVLEVRANLELLARLLVEQVALQQKLGYLPSAVQKVAVALAAQGSDSAATELVHLLRDLPSEAFFRLLFATHGEPGHRPE